jgi:hypothetical protein
MSPGAGINSCAKDEEIFEIYTVEAGFLGLLRGFGLKKHNKEYS